MIKSLCEEATVISIDCGKLISEDSNGSVRNVMQEIGVVFK